MTEEYKVEGDAESTSPENYARTFAGLEELQDALNRFTAKSAPTMRFVLMVGDIEDVLGSSIVTDVTDQEELRRLCVSVLLRLGAMARAGEILATPPGGK